MKFWGIHRELAVKALEQMRGDDLTRARSAFRHMTTHQLVQPHPETGISPAEELAALGKREIQIDAAIDWLRGL